MSLNPGSELLENGFGMGFISNEVIVSYEDFSFPPESIDCLQFLDELVRPFVPGFSAVKIHNIAELAIKWTPAGCLDAQSNVIIKINKIESGLRGLVHVGSFRIFNNSCRLTLLQCF